MFLYLLRRTESIGHDEVRGAVVIAPGPTEARRVFADASPNVIDHDGPLKCPGGEGSAPWLDTKRSTVRQIGWTASNRKPGVVQVDFNAG